MLTVSKFGGTSMGDAARMRQSASVAARRGARVVVVSATAGTTNELIALGRTALAGDGDGTSSMIARIRARHLGIAEDLKASSPVRERLDALLGELESIARGISLLRDCSPKALDTLMSFGERMSSALFVPAMDEALEGSGRTAEWLDVRDVLRTDDQFGKARPLTDEIAASCATRLAGVRGDRAVYVTQGFIGATADGATTTLGRGGSDYSAALLAEGIGADALEIWTDVPGIATTDPRLCAAARPIAEISFKEASELATFGAKVLHPATLLPAIRRNIPVFVGSSFDPDQRGTWVRREVKESPLVRALALRRRQTLVTLSTPEMLHAHGFLAKVFRVFDEHRVSIDAITTSEISVSFTVDDAALVDRKLLRALEPFADVQVEENLTLLSLIGNGINHTPGLAKKIFSAIDDINVRMICLGASKHNFCFLIAENRAEEAIRRLHGAFIEA